MRGGRSKANLFLLEFMIVILIFAIASAVCVNLFTASHVRSTASRDLHFALLIAQNAAENIKSCEGDLAAAEARFGSTLVSYADRDGKPCAADTAVYTLSIAPQPIAEAMFHATVSVHKAGNLIFSIPVACYVGGGRS